MDFILLIELSLSIQLQIHPLQHSDMNDYHQMYSIVFDCVQIATYSLNKFMESNNFAELTFYLCEYRESLFCLK
jgi:hypothetical protein